MSDKNQRPRRKRLLINPEFQSKLAIHAVTTTLLIVPIFIAANIYFFNLFNSKALSLGLPPEHEIYEFVARQQSLMVVAFIAATILAVIVSLVQTYFFSNRIAGSLYRLTYLMNQTTDLANAQKIQPRKVDFFKDLYEAYNHLIDRLKP